MARNGWPKKLRIACGAGEGMWSSVQLRRGLRPYLEYRRSCNGEVTRRISPPPSNWHRFYRRLEEIGARSWTGCDCSYSAGTDGLSWTVELDADDSSLYLCGNDALPPFANLYAQAGWYRFCGAVSQLLGGEPFWHFRWSEEGIECLPFFRDPGSCSAEAGPEQFNVRYGRGPRFREGGFIYRDNGRLIYERRFQDLPSCRLQLASQPEDWSELWRRLEGGGFLDDPTTSGPNPPGSHDEDGFIWSIDVKQGDRQFRTRGCGVSPDVTPESPPRCLQVLWGVLNSITELPVNLTGNRQPSDLMGPASENYWKVLQRGTGS